MLKIQTLHDMLPRPVSAVSYFFTTRIAKLLFPAFVLATLVACGGGEAPPAPVSGPVASAPAPAPTPVAAPDADYEPLVQQLFIGYFGRPADLAGLAHYSAALHSAGAPKSLLALSTAYTSNANVRDLIDGLAATQESVDLYPNSAYIGDDFTFIYAAYNNLFSRDPDINQATLWANQLNQHQITRPNVVLSIMAGAQGGNADIIAAKTDAALKFTNAVIASAHVNAYIGSVSHEIARTMLHGVPVAADAAVRQSMIDAAVSMTLASANGQFAEVQGPPRKIALLAASDQLATNGARLAALASSLVSDLNGPQHPNGPMWSVDVIAAASTVVATREQLKPYYGAILIGNIPIPTFIDKGTGGPAPALDPYRTPFCSAFQFSADGNALTNDPQLTIIDPTCRNGLVVSELRGRSASTQLADVANKLDQMIAYHRASQTINGNWLKSYQFIKAGWFGGDVMPDVSQDWKSITMYAPNMISYLSTGAGSATRSAYIDCISKNNEMCIFNGHGSPSTVIFEGPGIPGTFYSDDLVEFNSGDASIVPIKAKYLSLVSCSTQNFTLDNSLGTTLLMSGEALLTHGMVGVSAISSEYEQQTISDVFSVLATGGTFADAYLGKMEYRPDNFQGDPYITMRPVPSTKKPLLVIDGKHYNGVTMVFPLTLPDSVDGMMATKTLSIGNRGDADLHLKITVTPSNWGVGYGAASQGELEYGFNAAFKLASMSQSSVGAIIRDGPNQALTVKPGGTVALTYALTPNPLRKRNGNFSATFEIHSDDPASARLILEARGLLR